MYIKLAKSWSSNIWFWNPAVYPFTLEPHVLVWTNIWSLQSMKHIYKTEYNISEKKLLIFYSVFKK